MQARSTETGRMANICFFALLLSVCDGGTATCIQADEVWNASFDGPICIEGDLVVTGRRSEDLSFIEQVEAIEGSLWVHDNPDLTVLPRWPSLVRIDGALSISENPVLAVVQGFPALQELGGELYVAENPALLELALATKLPAVGSLFLAINSSLVEFHGLPALTQVKGDIRIAFNQSLATMSLPALVSVGGDFFLTANSALQTADFSRLRSTQRWTIEDNAALTSLSGFGALERITVAVVENNDALTQISWTAADVSRLFIASNAELAGVFASSSALPDHIFIEHNPELLALSGFSGVEVLEALRVDGNDRLAEISALGGLTRVGMLQVTRNSALVGPVEWFPRLEETTGDVWIFGNPGLDPAAVENLLARISVAGTTRVGDNSGEDTVFEPCPWPEDGICDAALGIRGRGTELCLTDPEDCNA